MTNREIIRELKRHGYSRVDIDTDSRAAKTFYTYRGGLHINGTGNLSFHIVPPQRVPDWDGLQYAPPVTGKAHSWGQTMPRSFSGGCLPSSKVREKRMR